jgi:hypothetical protein
MVEDNVVKVSLVDPEADSGNLTYSFDFDGDGTSIARARRPAQPGSTRADRYTVTIVIEDARWHTRRTLKRDIQIP